MTDLEAEIAEIEPLMMAFKQDLRTLMDKHHLPHDDGSVDKTFPTLLLSAVNLALLEWLLTVGGVPPIAVSAVKLHFFTQSQQACLDELQLVAQVMEESSSAGQTLQ